MNPGIASGKLDRLVAWLWIGSLAVGVGCDRTDKVGQLCDLTVDAGPSQAVVNLEAGGCRTGLCLKPAFAPGAGGLEVIDFSACGSKSSENA